MTITNTFDIEKLRLSPATAAAATVKKILSIPVDKPPRHDWIRVHPQEKIDVGGVILKDGDDELYLVEPDVAEVAPSRQAVASRPDVRFWPKADMAACTAHVRFGG
jgi:hypothetical protein